MEIKTVSVVGLGALGVMFAHRMAKHMPQRDLRFVADEERIRRYERDGVYCNGERCRFRYVTPQETGDPADLVLFAVKYKDLPDAIRAVKNQAGPDTVMLSLLNGISSEAIIGETYGMERLLLCVAQGMDAVKDGNRLTYQNMGVIAFGDREPGEISEKTRAVAAFFEKTGIPYETDTDMKKRLWGKFMVNVGVNQTVSVCECDYGGIQKAGPARDMMISAMREVMVLSEKEVVNLTQADLDYWLGILGRLGPKGIPSMRQDMLAKRPSEVDLFAGTVLLFAKKHGIDCPTNRMLYDRIKEMESRF